MKTLKALTQSTAEEPAAVAPPPPPAATQTRVRGRARANTNEPTSAQQTAASAASAANEDPHFNDGIDDPLPIPPGTADQIKMFNQINLKRDKEYRSIPPPMKSIYDRQPEAQKVAFDVEKELTETQSGDEPAKKPKQGGRKRGRDEIEGNDPFSLEVIPEEPQRNKRNRANPAPAAARPVASTGRRRRQLPAEVAPRNARQPSQERPSRDLVRRQSHDDILDELHGEGEIEMTGERVRYLAATNRQRAIEKKTQKRNPWSEEEEKKLVEMIGLYGCRWALIEREAPVPLADRGQVGLKDKARNMKFALLK